MSEITTLIVSNIITPIVAGIIGWLTARRKYNSEVDGNIINNMKESLEFYKKLSDDNKVRLDEVLALNKEILKLNKQLLEQNAKLEVEVLKLKEQVDLLTEASKTKKK